MKTPFVGNKICYKCYQTVSNFLVSKLSNFSTYILILLIWSDCATYSFKKLEKWSLSDYADNILITLLFNV